MLSVLLKPGLSGILEVNSTAAQSRVTDELSITGSPWSDLTC